MLESTVRKPQPVNSGKFIGAVARKAMSLEPVNEKSLIGLFRIALFVLGTFVGVCGSFFGLIGTQAITDQSTFEIFLGIAIYHVVSWGLGGLIVAAGFRRKRLRVAVLSGFISGGVIGALLVTAAMAPKASPSTAQPVQSTVIVASSTSMTPDLPTHERQTSSQTGSEAGFGIYKPLLALIFDILGPPAIAGALLALFGKGVA